MRKYTIQLVYITIGVLVLGLTLLPGYVLTLDMVFTPNLHYEWLQAGNQAVNQGLSTLLGAIIPGDIIEKLILLALFTLAGLGMHRLIPAKSQWAKYASGVLYVINPFTYSRLMAGQYLVLAGYALMPWFIAALIRFVRKPERGTALRLAAWTVAIGFVSLHYLGFAALAAVIAVALWAWRERNRPLELKRLGIWSGGVALVVLVVNSFWLIPLILHRSAQATLISGFDERYFLSFRTVADATFGQMLNTLALYGFWGDAQGWYLLPKSVFSFWWLIALSILVLAGLGAYKWWQKDRFTVVLMLTLLVVAFILAQGIMGSPFAPLNHWLMNHLPFYRGYREPGKFIGLMALSLCYLFGLGADWLLQNSRTWRFNSEWLPGLLVALPLLYTPTMLWGAAGQLHAVNYPPDWYALNRRLDAEHSSGKVLFLPWHQYINFKFAGRIIANPAPRFFDRPTIAGDNAEIGLIKRQSNNPQSTFIEGQILAPGRGDVAAKLKSHGFEYVVLAKEYDYKNYSWLDHTPGLTLTSDTQTLRVYQIR